MNKNYYVYILKCSDDSFYTGVTNNIERRIDEHNSGQIRGYTSTRLPVVLVFHTVFNDVFQAISFEKQVKGWSRKKKRAIINDNWADLPNLSKRKTSVHASSASA